MIIIRQTKAVNTPSIKTDAAAAAENLERTGLIIQNVGTNALYVNFGGTASTSVYHVVLKGGTADNDGIGGIYQSGVLCFTGKITVDGTSPKYIVTEFGN